jgi:hypothetical protein
MSPSLRRAGFSSDDIQEMHDVSTSTASDVGKR